MFNRYLSLAEESYQELKNDKAYIAERRKFHPNVNIVLSLEEAYIEHWSTEEGWIQMKKAKSKIINWKQIFNKMLHRKAHKVWYLKDQNNEQERKSRYTIVE